MAKRGSQEWHNRVREGKRRRDAEKAARTRVAPRDLRRLERSGTVAPALRPLLKIAAEEAYQLVEALGGPDAVSPQRRVLIEDLVAMGVVLRAVLASFLQSNDPELASKVATISTARRASLTALGLDRIEKEIDLGSYLESRSAEDHSGSTNATDPDALPAEAAPDASPGEGGAAEDHLSFPTAVSPSTPPAASDEVTDA